MSSETQKTPLGEKLSKIARVVLLSAIAVVLGLMIVGPREPGSSFPMYMSPAQANSVGAAPGYLMLTVQVGPASTLYISDTNKQVVCGYSMTGDKLLLVSARKFDYDGDIFDSTIPAPRALTGNGISREDAKQYGENIKKIKENPPAGKR